MVRRRAERSKKRGRRQRKVPPSAEVAVSLDDSHGSRTAHRSRRGHDGVSCTDRDRESHIRPQDDQGGSIGLDGADQPSVGLLKGFSRRMSYSPKLPATQLEKNRPEWGPRGVGVGPGRAARFRPR
ncbi:hypothetical protein BHE74_00044978 [Ensete ventricosum]|nr:hypothetical protein BHE74_00044978 [Ensete ventricosum]RZS00163.1 hypothetical protein BHM03_00029835 [Ensete ventricosum]